MDLERLRPQPDKRLTFFQAFLKEPTRVGSVIPSSRFLERRVAAAADLARARLVVELGPGTGGISRAILRALSPEATLLAIELDPRLVRVLDEEPDPRLVPHHGSAEHIGAALAEHGLGPADVVVSGIPFSTMPRRLGRAILAEVERCLVPGGQFVAYQFRDRVATLGREVFGRPEVEMELLNIPPMRVYTWRVDGAAAGARRR